VPNWARWWSLRIDGIFRICRFAPNLRRKRASEPAAEILSEAKDLLHQPKSACKPALPETWPRMYANKTNLKS
jgi:hypothetical protein